MSILSKIIPTAHAAITQGDSLTGPGTFQNITTANAGTSLEGLISIAVGALTAVAGIGFLLYFMIGGITWITAGDDQAKHQKARKQLTDAAIGLVVVAVAYAIAGVIGVVLGIDILNPSALLGL